MKATVGLNIIPQGGLHNWGALVQYIADTAPHEAMLVMNEPGKAQQLAPYVRHMVHRLQTPNDQSLYANMSPEAFVSSLPNLGENVYHQILNEPGGGNLVDYAQQVEMANWTAAAMRYASSRRIRLTGPAHAVGNPHETFFGKGVYDPILKELKGWHTWMQHEYFVNHPALEKPHHIGRVFNVRARARQIGLPDPKVIIGEAGRDVAGKPGPDGDGWKNANWQPGTPEEYWNRLRAQAEIYRPYGYPMLVFCVGEGFGDWISFDIQKESFIFSAMTAYNKTVPDIAVGGVITVTPKPLPPGTPTKDGYVAVIPGAFVNMREAPTTSAKDVGDVMKQEALVYAEPASEPDWYWVQKTGGLSGWVSKQGGNVQIKEIEVIPPPVIENGYLTKADLSALAALHRDIAAIYEAAAARE